MSLTITAEFTQGNNHRRGMIPTPDGALPKPKRARRGMVDLAAWDRRVAADNDANGTTSQTNHDGPPASPQPILLPQGDHGADPVSVFPETTRMALVEQDESPPPPIDIPPPTEAGILAAKAAIAQAERQAATADTFVPPPPKPAKKDRKP